MPPSSRLSAPGRFESRPALPRPAPSGSAPLRVALLGLGTVGAEVARALVERGDDLQAAARGRRLTLVAVGVRDPGRKRSVSLPPDVRRTDDLASVATAPDVDIVVELIGGLEPPGALVSWALDARKAVVTANKALLARQGPRLEALARSRRVPLRFEAAVGGGIPILAPLGGDLAANRWHALRGIVNGSTNFILSRMAESGDAFESVVAEARARGYLEMDASADVEGRDAADKLAVLVRLTFGAWPDVGAIRRAPPALEGDGVPGIAGVSARLVEGGRREGMAIKLVACARRLDDGRIDASVLLAAIPDDRPLARTAAADNRIELEGEPVGRLAFSGPGAGGAATSSAVLGDILAIARGEGSTWGGLPPAGPLAASRLGDGLEGPRRWLVGDAPGEGGLTSSLTLAALRSQLAGWEGPIPTFIPVLDEA